MPIKVAQVSSFVNFAGKYMSTMSNSDLDATKQLELTGIKKYWSRTRQVKIELN